MALDKQKIELCLKVLSDKIRLETVDKHISM